MDDNTALVEFINSTGFVRVTCITTYDPKRVEITLPAGLAIILPYTTYQDIRAQAGLPDDVCGPDNTND